MGYGYVFDFSIGIVVVDIVVVTGSRPFGAYGGRNFGALRGAGEKEDFNVIVVVLVVAMVGAVLAILVVVWKLCVGGGINLNMM